MPPWGPAPFDARGPGVVRGAFVLRGAVALREAFALRGAFARRGVAAAPRRTVNAHDRREITRCAPRGSGDLAPIV
ncbi:hypothetical protein [Microbacterium hydrothermale]|uniref:hypothetical protein n=1 Tax=Microbacterium hydrothermale TaxID=857427 RepID=UPI00142DD948|nr:hypothetical protein [Microbacterium hydrothermale]